MIYLHDAFDGRKPPSSQALVNGSDTEFKHLALFSVLRIQVKTQIDPDGTERREPSNTRAGAYSDREEIAKFIEPLAHITEDSSSQAKLARQGEENFGGKNRHLVRTEGLFVPV